MKYTNDTYDMLLHSMRVGFLGKAVGLKMNLDSETCNQLLIAGLFHDFGKLMMDQDILNKKTPLTESEYIYLQNHVSAGMGYLENMPFNRFIIDAILQHHESPDGTGYPFMLHGRLLTLGGSIIKVCDGFDALTSDRPYRNHFSTKEALAIMESEEGKYDTKSFRALKEVVLNNDFSFILDLESTGKDKFLENNLKGI